MYLVAELQTSIDESLEEKLDYIICGKKEQGIEVSGDPYSTIEAAEEKYHEILNRAAISNSYKHGAMIMDEECTPLKYYYFLHKEAAEIEHIVAEVVWVDGDNNDGVRPQNLTLQLKDQNGNIGTSVEISAADNWLHDFGKYLKYADGELRNFEIEISTWDTNSKYPNPQVNGYQTIYTHELETINVNGQINWSGGTRPQNVTIRLLANGEEVDYQLVTGEGSPWSYNFTPNKYLNGTEIAYTVSEDSIDNYEIDLEGYNFTNTYKEYTDMVGNIVFNDTVDNLTYKHYRPEIVIVKLKENTTEVDSTSISINEDSDEFYYSFENVLVISGITTHTYSIDFPNIDNYNKSINGNNVTYTIISEGLTPDESDSSDEEEQTQQ
jgi:hypothetical protein